MTLLLMFVFKVCFQDHCSTAAASFCSDVLHPCSSMHDQLCKLLPHLKCFFMKKVLFCTYPAHHELESVIIISSSSIIVDFIITITILLLLLLLWLYCYYDD